MPVFRVFYRKEPTFMLDKNLKKEQVLGQKTHCFVGSLSAADMEVVFHDMQGDFMSRQNLKQVADARAKCGIMLHTSMSVGDCVQNMATKKVYECANAGYQEVR